MHQLVLIGGGGHCKACIEVIEQEKTYEIVGILDQPDLVGSDVLGYPVIGTDDDILAYIQKGCHFLITVGQIKTALIRKKIFSFLVENGAIMATVISPIAHVSKHAKIGKGTIVMHHVTVNADAKVGNNCILNTGCCIEHDAFIGTHTHISTHAVVNGDVKIGDEVFVGSNATISSQITIGDEIIIGAGAVVVKHLADQKVYVGNPAENLKNRSQILKK